MTFFQIVLLVIASYLVIGILYSIIHFIRYKSVEADKLGWLMMFTILVIAWPLFIKWTIDAVFRDFKNSKEEEKLK